MIKSIPLQGRQWPQEQKQMAVLKYFQTLQYIANSTSALHNTPSSMQGILLAVTPCMEESVAMSLLVAMTSQLLPIVFYKNFEFEKGSRDCNKSKETSIRS